MVQHHVGKAPMVRDSAEIGHVRGVQRERVVMHGNGQLGLDRQCETDGLFTGEVAFELETVPKRVAPVDRQEGHIDRMAVHPRGLTRIRDRVAGVKERPARQRDDIAQIGVAVCRISVEFLVLGRYRVDADATHFERVVSPQRVDPIWPDAETEHRLARTLGYNEKCAVRLPGNDWKAVRIDMVGMVVRTQNEIGVG